MGLLNKFRAVGKRKSLQEEVADHLTALFNTKQSFGAWQKGLGMRAYSSGKSHAEIIEEIIADMKYNIENFEKRIKLVEIKALNAKNIFNLRFQVKCQLGSTFHSYYVGFNKTQNPIEVEVTK